MYVFMNGLPSVLCRWAVGRKGIQPVRKQSVGLLVMMITWPLKLMLGAVFNLPACHAVNLLVHDWRPSLSSGSSMCLELSAIERQDCLVFERVSGRPQNSSVQGIIW